MAAQMLSGYGFEKIYNLKGGIMAWNGLVAEGPQELHLELIRGDETPAEILKMAYGMEKSLGDFYRTVATRTPDRELAALVKTLASVEDKHMEYLLEIGKELDPGGFDREAADAEALASAMEGGFRGDELTKNNERLLESVDAMLDLSMMLETQALDLYMRFAGKSQDEAARKILFRIADEEKTHLAALGKLRDERA
ncbi:MAG: ferritin-like domain-containing protein [Desulfomonile tiedjei]|nr:ferritin-like domain-containing protein [Desulfomonile tiedjei]